MDDVARTLNRLAYKTDLAIDRLTASLATAVADAVARHAVKQPDGRSVITPLARLLILRDVDKALSSVYGAYRGDRRAPIYRAIAGPAAEAHRAAVEATAGEMRTRLKGEPALLAALDGGR